MTYRNYALQYLGGSLHNPAQFSDVPPHAPIGIGYEQFRIAPLRVELLRRRGGNHIFGTHSLPHQLDEAVLHRGQHLRLGFQVGAGL